MLYVHYNTSTSPTETPLCLIRLHRALSVASQRDSLEFLGYEKKHIINVFRYDGNFFYEFSFKKVFKSLHLRNVGVISHACCPKHVVPYMELFCHVKIRLSVEIK